MTKEEIVLIVARNGLDTAQVILEANARKADKAAQKAAGDEKAKLEKASDKARKLFVALNAAEAGLNDYLANI